MLGISKEGIKANNQIAQPLSDKPPKYIIEVKERCASNNVRINVDILVIEILLHDHSNLSDPYSKATEFFLRLRSDQPDDSNSFGTSHKITPAKRPLVDVIVESESFYNKQSREP